MKCRQTLALPSRLRRLGFPPPLRIGSKPIRGCHLTHQSVAPIRSLACGRARSCQSLKPPPACVRWRSSRGCAAVIPILPRACAGPWSVAWHDDGRSMDQPGRDVPPRAPAGPDGPVGLTWPPSAWRLRTSPWRTGFTTSGSPFRALHAHVVPGGENFVALAERLQNELWGAGRRAATAPQCAHYGMTPIPTRITRS